MTEVNSSNMIECPQREKTEEKRMENYIHALRIREEQIQGYSEELRKNRGKERQTGMTNRHNFTVTSRPPAARSGLLVRSSLQECPRSAGFELGHLFTVLVVFAHSRAQMSVAVNTSGSRSQHKSKCRGCEVSNTTAEARCPSE